MKNISKLTASVIKGDVSMSEERAISAEDVTTTADFGTAGDQAETFTSTRDEELERAILRVRDLSATLQSARGVPSNQSWSGPLVTGATSGPQPTDSGFMTLDALEKRCAAQPTSYLVDGLLPAEDLHCAVGDSGLGKTPWAYQLGLCVATGTTFLGHACRQAKVLYYDLENGPEQILSVARGICTHLNINLFPSDFLVFPGDADPPDVPTAVALHRPELVIVDTLRAFWPDAESDNTQMGLRLKALRKTTRDYHCAILLQHHVRKPSTARHGSSKHKPTPLENTPVLQWLNQASGARALIDQTNTRIAFDAPQRASGADLVVKQFIKVKGERGPELLGRVIDPTTGEPVAYQRLAGVSLLNNTDQATAFNKLPQKFTFKDAKAAYGKTDNPTREFLLKCEAAGLLRQTGRGEYVKV
jgi:hypothetical protein